MITLTRLRLLISLLLLMGCSFVGRSQFQELDSLDIKSLKIYYSKGHKTRATEMASRMQDCIQFADTILHYRPVVTLLILSPVDWPRYTKFPVYGMPHYSNDFTLVVASENNAFWKSFIPPLTELPAELAAMVRKAYSEKDGQLSMQPFFDLLALHELAHAYHRQASLNMQRKWMGELFCNVFLHTYIAERQPQLLPALTVFPNMVVAGRSKSYTFTTLDQFESNYAEIASKHAKNYGWYQCRLHVAAATIYDAGGKLVLPKLWTMLQDKTYKDDQELAKELGTKVHTSIADVMLKW